MKKVIYLSAALAVLACDAFGMETLDERIQVAQEAHSQKVAAVNDAFAKVKKEKASYPLAVRLAIGARNPVFSDLDTKLAGLGSEAAQEAYQEFHKALDEAKKAEDALSKLLLEQKEKKENTENQTSGGSSGSSGSTLPKKSAADELAESVKGLGKDFSDLVMNCVKFEDGQFVKKEPEAGRLEANTAAAHRLIVFADGQGEKLSDVEKLLFPDINIGDLINALKTVDDTNGVEAANGAAGKIEQWRKLCSEDSSFDYKHNVKRIGDTLTSIGLVKALGRQLFSEIKSFEFYDTAASEEEVEAAVHANLPAAVTAIFNADMTPKAGDAKANFRGLLALGTDDNTKTLVLQLIRRYVVASLSKKESD